MKGSTSGIVLKSFRNEGTEFHSKPLVSVSTFNHFIGLKDILISFHQCCITIVILVKNLQPFLCLLLD